MWLSKDKKRNDDIEVVKCDKCSSLVSLDDAQKVSGVHGTQEYYCDEHKVPYNKKRYFYDGTTGERIAFYGEVEMDEKGTPIGYTKTLESNIEEQS